MIHANLRGLNYAGAIYPRLPSSSGPTVFSNTMLNDLSFNQDFSCLSMSSSEYHKIFNCDPFGEFYMSGKEANNGATYMLRMLFSTSLTIVVPESSDGGRRVLKVLNLKQNLKICELTFPSNIIDLMLNRKRLVVFLEVGQIYIYDLSSVRLLKVLDTEGFGNVDAKHPRVAADLSPDDASYLVFPLSMVNQSTDLFSDNTDESPASLNPLIEFTHKNSQSDLSKKENITLKDLQEDPQGWVVVYDTIKLKPCLIYKAHDSQIAKIAISNKSKYIATASTKGTIIRVCHTSTDLLEETGKLKITQVTNLRRGHNAAKINSLRFNLDSSLLGCGSESGTVHFFTLNGSSHSPDSSHSDDEETHSDEESRTRQSSSEDLNENLANLLLSKQHDESPPREKDESKSYFSALKSSAKLLNNPYAKSIMKRLPYKNYIETLIWEKPRRSFAFVKLPEGKVQNPQPKNVEIGFSNSGTAMVACYDTGMLYQYVLPEEKTGEREECRLLVSNSLID